MVSPVRPCAAIMPAPSPTTPMRSGADGPPARRLALCATARPSALALSKPQAGSIRRSGALVLRALVDAGLLHDEARLLGVLVDLAQDLHDAIEIAHTLDERALGRKLAPDPTPRPPRK